MSFKPTLLAMSLALMSLAAQATSVSLAADDQWHAFAVDELSSVSGGTEWIDSEDSNAPGYGSPLDFSFSIGAGFVGTLTVVDGALAGDTFQVFNHGVLLGGTGSVPQGVYGSTPNVGDDFDAALSQAAFSHGVFTLGAGSYRIGGALLQSVGFEDAGGEITPLNATNGALKLSVSAVPEPSSAALAVAALCVGVLLSRRRPGSSRFSR